MKYNLEEMINEQYKKLFEKRNSEWFEEGDKELSEEEINEICQLFDDFCNNLDETGKSQFAGKLIGLGVLKKDEKTGKLVKGDKEMSTKDAIKRLEKGK